MSTNSKELDLWTPRDDVVGLLQEDKQLPASSSKVEEKLPAGGTAFERVKKVTNFSKLVHDGWLFEAMALFASCVFFAIAVGVLHHWDGRYATDFNPNFTLHSVISFLATLMKAAMFITITACIGQLKWHHFSKAKTNPVIDMDRIENVARGATGSLMYLLRFGFLHFVSLGAILSIASLLLGSTMVNMLNQDTYAYRAHNASINARLGITNQYSNASSIDSESKHFYPVGAMQAAAITGWWFQNSDQELNQILSNVHCSSGACNWTSVSNLVIRSKCVAVPVELSNSSGVYVSSQADINSTVVNPTNGNPGTYNTTYHLIARYPAPASSTFAAGGANAFDGATIVHLAAIGLSPVIRDAYEAAECIVYWAVVKTEQPYARNNTFQTFWEFDEEYNTTEQTNSSSGNIIISPSWKQEPGCIFGRQKFTMHDPTCDFTVTSNAHHGIRNFLTSFLTISEYTQKAEKDNTTFRIITNDAINAFATHVSGFASLSAALSSFLTYTTQFMSTEVSQSPALINGELQDGSALGTMFTLENKFTVKWLWVIYGLVMLLGTAFLFAITIWNSRNEAIWKNSYLPTLYHGLEISDDTGSYKIRELAGMEDVAKKQKAIMEESGKRLKVVPDRNASS